MDEQEQQNQNDSFLKNQFNKGKEALKNETKKQGKKAAKKIIIKILSNPLTWKILAIVIIVTCIITLLTSFLNIIIGHNEGKVNDAKHSTIITNYSGSASAVQTDANGNTVNKVVINSNDTNDGYELTFNDDSENLDNTKEQLEEQIPGSSSEFSDVELGIIGALIEGGADLQYYSVEELHCFLHFIKAEAATKNLDLRPNSEKIVNGEYVPQKAEDLAEDEIPGVILVQRTNTNGNTSTILEYMPKEQFEQLVQDPANNKNAINYFTISDDGNLIIAKWDHILITVEGEYPESLDESEKDMPKDENIVTTEEIPYSQYIAKYTMPFEFLLQLLLTTDEPDFCMELVDYVLGSKIVINIKEKETLTVTDETRNYTVHSKDKKSVSYQVNAVGQQIVNDNYAFNYMKDDEQNDCTNYSKTDLTVKVHTEYTSHSYAFEIVEADTWIARYKKTYTNQPAVTHPTTSNTAESKGQYEQIEPEEEQPITDKETINKDKDVTTFINETKGNYEAKLIVPEDIIISGVITDEDENKYKTLSVKYKDGITKEYTKCFEVKDESGNGTGEYNLPQTVTVTTDKVAATDKIKEIPQINYIFKLETSKNLIGQTVYDYKLQTNIDPLVECIVSSLNIEKFEKLDLSNTIETTTTEYTADPNPVTQSYIYAKDGNGNFEKFLLAYDRSPIAQNQLSSIDSWLYEMMEERASTVELVDTVKYLLYVYDGVDRGVTELELDLFNSSEFVNFSNGSGWWWPIGSSNVEIINGLEFARGEPVSSTITSGVGPRWGKNHGGIDISNGIRGTNIIASKSGTVMIVVDGFGDGYYGSRDGGGYGNHIKIQHDDGTYSIYAHLERGTIKVSQGDRVEQGQLLGGMGTSGSSTGIHLHFEIRDANNNKLDPEDYVDPENPRQTLASASLRGWLWGIEGGSQYINGNVWTVFDPVGNDNTMNLAHGMVIASYNGADSWYPDIVPGKITVGQTVTADQANQIWEKKIKGFNDAIDSACAKYGVTLTPNQKDALVSYIYRTGYGVGQNNSIVSAYASGGNAGLWNYMKNGYDKRAEYEAGTKKRIAEEYELFVKGDYTYNPNGTAKYDQYCNNPNI